jgi:hypothetical protein
MTIARIDQLLRSHRSLLFDAAKVSHEIHCDDPSKFYAWGEYLPDVIYENWGSLSLMERAIAAICADERGCFAAQNEDRD